MRSSETFLLVSALLFRGAVAQQPVAPPVPAVPPAPPASTPQSPAQRPRPADGKALLAMFAQMSGLEARFEEEKFLSLLALPLKSKGRLYFLPPGHLTRIVEEPESSTMRITPEELRMQTRDGVEVIDLRRSDKVRLFITSLVQVFAGAEEPLRKSFAIEFTEDPKLARAWTMTLTPRAKPLDQMMRALVLHGEGEAVVRIEVHEPNGDRTVTRIVGADPARQFDAVERKRWFLLESR